MHAENKCVYLLHDKPDLLHEHFPITVALVDVENLKDVENSTRGTASVIDDGQLLEIRAVENMLLSLVIPDRTHRVPLATDRTINIGNLPKQLVTRKGTIFNMEWDNNLFPKCTLQLIGRLTNVWGYEYNGQYMSGITWDVDRIYVETVENLV